MAQKILMPKMSDTMEEGVIASWLKKVGDKVKSGDIIAEVETDKATMELEAYESGTLLYLVPEKSAVKVDGLIAVIGAPGEAFEHLLSEGGGGNQTVQVQNEPAVSTQSVAVSTPVVTTENIKAKVIQMPKMSDTMEEGVIAVWHKKVGDKVKSGELLAEIETDKATMEYEAEASGTLLFIAAEKGQAVKVDGLLCIIGEEGADYQALIAQFNAQGQQPVQVKEEKTSAVQETSKESQVKEEQLSTNGRVKISPLAKKLAKEKGIDIKLLKGSGEGGRIVKRDIENFVPQSTPAKEESKVAQAMPFVPLGQESFEEIPISQMRKTIARRLSESKFTAPHFYLTIEILMDEAIKARESLNEVSPVKISFNDMVVKASAMALRKHPAVNSSWLSDKIRYNHHVHVGVAVAVDEGLLVPVIRFADQKSLSQIAAETKDLAGKAKNKKLQPQDWAGNTFSVSNLGMFGIEEFTAIINPPDACIMAVGGIKEVVLVKNGQMTPGNVMKVTLSCDHRVVDGASGAAFLKSFKELMEAPVRMLV